MSRSKIVCTIGPASRTPEIIGKLIEAGMNVARLNFSHGTHEEHAENVRMIRETAERMGRSVAILQDLSGPKIRVGKFAEGQIHLKDDATFNLTTRDVAGCEKEVSVNYAKLPFELSVGDLLLLADGALELEVIECSDEDIGCRVIVGGILGSNKGINLPTSNTKIPCLTEKDKKDLVFGLEQDVDFVALSFVRAASDIHTVRELIHAHDLDTPVIAKIEKHEAIQHIDEIVEAADGLMVARGDLGIEIPFEQVPAVQKMVIAKANAAAKPVITATQMLGSMVHHPRPTRAEVTDVCNAVLDGTDAIMLSEETAIGDYPVRTVETMKKICTHAELHFPYEMWTQRFDVGKSESIPEAVSHAACHLAENMDASAIVAFTQKGGSAHLLSKFRPHARILAVTPLLRSYRALSLLWGVVPIKIDPMQSAEQSVGLAASIAQESGRVNSGECYIITGGVPVGDSGTTNSITTAVLP